MTNFLKTAGLFSVVAGFIALSALGSVGVI